MRSLSRRPDANLAPLPFTAPRTSINGAITPGPHRRRVQRLALRGEAGEERLRHHRQRRGARPCAPAPSAATSTERGEEVDGPLLAMVPVSVRPEEARADMGNQVATIFATLATDIDDPVERLLAIHEGMKDAKEQHRAIGAETLTNWAEFAAPAVFGRAMRLYARMGLADRHRPVFNLTISNVPGPPFPLYSAGAKLEANFPLGPDLRRRRAQHHGDGPRGQPRLRHPDLPRRRRRRVDHQRRAPRPLAELSHGCRRSWVGGPGAAKQRR